MDEAVAASRSNRTPGGRSDRAFGGPRGGLRGDSGRGREPALRVSLLYRGGGRGRDV